ncbi:MAG: hypothetical protein QXY67_03515, partial [Zestosphaera sp.]
YVDEFIEVGIETEETELKEALNALRDYIAKEVRAAHIYDEITSDMLIEDWDIEGMKVKIGIKRLKELN